MKSSLIFTVLLFSQTILATPYYRFYRGVKLPQLQENAYLKEMAQNFVPLAPQLFPHLQNYLVAIPANKTGVDEVALLSYTSEEAYIQGRSTAEGRAYGDAHWTVFEQSKSGSLVPEVLKTIEANKAYDVLQTDVDWSKGYTTFYIGEKLPNLSPESFLQGLDVHVKRVRSYFSRAGLKGYVIITTPDREYAFMNWESKRHVDYAFSKPEGKIVLGEANRLMKTLNYTESGWFQGKLLRDQTYTVK